MLYKLKYKLMIFLVLLFCADIVKFQTILHTLKLFLLKYENIKYLEMIIYGRIKKLKIFEFHLIFRIYVKIFLKRIIFAELDLFVLVVSLLFGCVCVEVKCVFFCMLGRSVRVCVCV